MCVSEEEKKEHVKKIGNINTEQLDARVQPQGLEVWTKEHNRENASWKLEWRWILSIREKQFEKNVSRNIRETLGPKPPPAQGQGWGFLQLLFEIAQVCYQLHLQVH